MPTLIYIYKTIYRTLRPMKHKKIKTTRHWKESHKDIQGTPSSL